MNREPNDSSAMRGTGDNGNYTAPTRGEAAELEENLQKAANASFSDDSQNGHAHADNNDAAEVPAKLWTIKNLLIVLPVIINPFFFGYSNGIFGVYITMYGYATNCQLYTAQKPCETLSGAKCRWMDATGSPAGVTGSVCGWADSTTCFTTYTSEESCKADPVCAWNVKDSKCGNQVGYTSSRAGLFGAAMIIGVMVGSFTSGYLTTKLNFRLSFFFIGLFATIAAVLMHVSTAFYNYWLMFVARIILGFPIGWQGYASSAYTNTFAPPNYRMTFGTIFQITMSFGAFVGPIMGILLGYTIDFSADRDASVKGRMQGLVALLTLLTVISITLLPLLTKNVKSAHEEQNDAQKDAAPAKAANDDDKYTMLQMLFRCFIAVLMAATLQLTGVSAITNYTPMIMGSYGLHPLVGNVILMAWNAVIAFAVLPLSRVIPLRTLFLFGGVVTSACCMFLCGVPVYPGVSKTASVKNGVALAGIFIYIGVYQICVGPSYFVIAIDMFPVSFKPYGMSVIMFAMCVFNLIITLCYPIATEGISGGPSGNPDKGQAVAFIFFGCIGFITVAVEYFFMHPWEKRKIHHRTNGADASTQ